MKRNENEKKKIRECAAISLQEIKEDQTRLRELATEVVMLAGYIGFIDVESYGVRVFVFQTGGDADRLVEEAKKMNYRTAGRVEGFTFIRNSSCERPHLDKVPKSWFYSELYK